LGIGDWAQSPIPNPQSPIPNPQSPKRPIKKIFGMKFLKNIIKTLIFMNKSIKLFSWMKVKLITIYQS